MTFATQRWRCGSADTALRDRLDAFYVAGRQAELGQVVELRRDRSWPRSGGGGPAQARTIQTALGELEAAGLASGTEEGGGRARYWSPTGPNLDADRAGDGQPGDGGGEDTA